MLSTSSPIVFVLAFILAAYVIGSIPFAIIMSKLFCLPDPRTYGSKNPGATNVLRSGKKIAALLTLLGDGAKGWLAVFITQLYAPENYYLIAGAGLAVFLGHLFPLFLRFQGGKGVATFIGIAIAFNSWLGLGVMLAWVIVAIAFRYSSLASLLSAVTAFVIALSLWGLDPRTLCLLLIALLIIWRHSKNIQNLRLGKEGKIGQRS